MRQAYWIGGGSGGGKSTVARRLAQRYGLRRYDTDEAMADHARRCTDCPNLTEFIAMDMDQRWLRDPRIMLDTFHWYRGEGFGLILEDLAGIAESVVVEGFRLLPDLVAPQLGPSDAAVWLLPTPGFRRAAFTGRGSLWTIAGRTSDPPRPWRTCWNATPSSPNGSRPRPRACRCPASRSTAPSPRTSSPTASRRPST